MGQGDDIAKRAAVLALRSSVGGKSTAATAEATGLSVRTVNSILVRAVQRGFDPNQVPLNIKSSYVEDGKRSGRPKKQTDTLAE